MPVRAPVFLFLSRTDGFAECHRFRSINNDDDDGGDDGVGTQSNIISVFLVFSRVKKKKIYTRKGRSSVKGVDGRHIFKTNRETR